MTEHLVALALVVSGQAHGAVAKKPAPKKPAPVTEVKKAKDKPMIAVFDTSLGKFKAKLFTDKAPQTVANFVALAEGSKTYTNPKTGKKVEGTEAKHGTPYYDGVIFHRIIPDFMVQGGDPTGTGGGGPGFTIKDEVDKSLKHDKPGKLSMAKTAAPDSAGSQFFITVAATPWLDGTYTQFGEVTEGMDVVMKMSHLPTGAQDRPNDPPVIKSIKIER